MGEFSVSDFIKEVEIKRNPEDDCEYEVTEKAMKFFLDKYACYSVADGWDIRKTKKDDKIKGYSGSYELYKNEVVLTADILTEIRSPVRKVSEDGKLPNGINNGIGIVKGIFDDEIVFSDRSIKPYVKSFAYVYYWIGNMLPVPGNPLGLADRGTWRNKVLFLCGKRERETNLGKVWKDWELPENWQTLFYFQDAFSSLEVKPFYEGLEDEKYVFFSYSKRYNPKKWFLNNAKLIIQRSYRIQNSTMKTWDEVRLDIGRTNRECVQDVFREVFVKKARIAENEEGLLDLF